MHLITRKVQKEVQRIWGGIAKISRTYHKSWILVSKNCEIKSKSKGNGGVEQIKMGSVRQNDKKTKRPHPEPLYHLQHENRLNRQEYRKEYKFAV